MSKEAICLLNTIKAVLNGETRISLPEGINFEKLYLFSKAHGLSGFVACCPQVMASLPKEVQGKFRYEFNISVAKETAQERVVSLFLGKMEEAGLRCLPLKGFYIKKKYPIPALRQMTDTDILIDADKVQEIIPIMESLGMKYDHDTLHEIIFKNSQLVIELHKELIPSNMGRLYEYYMDGWSKAILCEGKKAVYEMSPEDTYIFMVNHIAKHYAGGGIGIKHVADVFVMSKEDLDEKYIDAELSKLGIDDFHGLLKNVANMWFSLEKNVEYDDKTLEMAHFILESGEFGNNENRTASGVLKKDNGRVSWGAKIRRTVRRIFPSMGSMKLLYPAVKKFEFLYPIYVVVRIFDVLFNRKKEIKNLLLLINAKQEKIDLFAEHCSRMGLPKDF